MELTTKNERIMNRYIHIGIIAAAALSLASCDKESQEKTVDMQEKGGALTAVLPSTRTAIDMSGNVVWNSGDQIMVYSSARPLGAKYSTESDQETSGAFNPEGESVTGDKLYAVYPASAANGAQLSGENIEINFAGLAEQTYSGALDASANISKVPMAAVSSGKKLMFSNLCGGLKFRIADWQDMGIMVKSIEVKANGGELLTGKATVNLADMTYTLKDGGSAVNVNIDRGISIGTASHRDESKDFIIFIPAGKYSKGFTFTITDKVYDRAMPIELNERAAPFECEPQAACRITSAHLQAMFEKAKQDYPISEATQVKLDKLDGYLQTRFKLAFGNRIIKQMHDFIPVYVACGGKELDGMDYIVARKVLKKLESLNVTFVRDEIRGLVEYIEKVFGKSNMADSKAYLTRIQNLY